MRRWWNTSIIALLMLLGGCANTVVRSDVTAFHEWPVEMPEKVYVFDRTGEQNNDLEYRSYENLVRSELRRLGFVEAATPQQAQLKVGLTYSIKGRDVRVVQATVATPFWYDSPLYGHRWRGRGYYGPFYDPFWPPPVNTGYVESTYEVFTRQVRVTIAQRQSGRNLYDVTVNSEGGNGSLALMMPYLVRSAFDGFPGVSGVPRRVSLKMQD